MAPTPQLRFGPFCLDPHQRRLWRGGEIIVLRPRAFAVLCYVAARPGALVPRAELLQQVWKGVSVSGAVVRACIRDIRAALGDQATSPQYLETVGRQGYRFLGGLDGHAPARLDAGPVVGREAEVAQLQQCYRRALAGERQLIFLSGEVGIGKTTVVELFLASLIGSQTRISRGQCVEQYGAGEPYLPILEALGHLGGAPGGERVVAVLQHYAPLGLAQLPALVPEAEWERLQRRVHGTSQGRMLRELADALSVLTAETPLVVVLEDLHWSDPATLTLLGYLAQRREPARLWLLGTYRPADAVVQAHPVRGLVQEPHGRGVCTEMMLELLTVADVAAYVSGRLGGTVTPVLADLVYRHSEGNALFMVNMLEHLRQQGRLVRAEGQWTLCGVCTAAEIRLPEKLRQLVTRRLEALPEATQRVLEATAVVGDEFAVAAVAAGLQHPIVAVEAVCEAVARQGQFLAAAGLAGWPDGTRSGRYRFQHAQYRQVCYERLGAARRAHLHAQIGARLEAGYGARAPELASELAVHYAWGLAPSRSMVYQRYAGETALQRYAYQEAIAHCEAGLESYTTLPPTSELTIHALALSLTLGAAYLATEGFSSPVVEQAYRHAYVLAQELGDTPQMFSALYGLGSFFRVRAEFATAYALMEQLMHVAQGAQDPALLLIAHSALGGMLRYWRDGLGQARWHLEQSLALYDPAQHSILPSRYGLHPQVSCLANLGTLLWQVGYPTQAHQWSHDAVLLAQAVGSPFDVTVALAYDALLQQMCGARQQAQERTDAEAVRIAQATEESAITAPLYILQGELLLMQAGTVSAVQQAEACWHQALDLARRRQTKSWELRAALRLSRLWQRQGKRLQARQLLAPLYGWFTIPSAPRAQRPPPQQPLVERQRPDHHHRAEPPRIARNMAGHQSPGQAEDDRKDKIQWVGRHGHEPDAQCYNRCNGVDDRYRPLYGAHFQPITSCLHLTSGELLPS